MTRGSQLSVDGRPRKKSAGPGLATKRAELLQDKPIVPNRNVGSKLKVITFNCLFGNLVLVVMLRY